MWSFTSGLVLYKEQTGESLPKILCNLQLALRPSQVIEPDILRATGEGVGPVVTFLLQTDGFRSPLKEGRRKASLLSSQTDSCHSGVRSKNEGEPRIQRGWGRGWSPCSSTSADDLLFELFFCL